MEGGTETAAAAAFTNIHTAASTAGTIATGSNLDESERSVISINHLQIDTPERRCFLKTFKTFFS